MSLKPIAFDIDSLDFDKRGGTVTVVAQDAVSGAVLMVAAADRQALERTIETGEMHYLSRTRGPWHKGATSGNIQQVESMHADCDGDTVLARVLPAGPACHTGLDSCFGRRALAADAIGTLDSTIASRASDPPADSYTRRLLEDRNLRLKKIGEEAAELVVACAENDSERATSEAADLIYHTLVAARAAGATLADVRRELHRRRAAAER
jgi:phosphoribosyl-ATP pyrophosphohydrolase/phosphoribosyl-AMP cyclohydrolase